MTAPQSFKWSFRNVYVNDPESIIFVLAYDQALNTDQFVTSLALWQDHAWESQDSIHADGTAFTMLHKQRLSLMLGKEGNIYYWRDDAGFDVEAVDPSDYGPQNYGDLEDLRVIGGKAYVAGMARSVYRRSDSGEWQALDRDIRSEEDDDAGFMSIDGYDNNEIYAVGINGEIGWYNGNSWQLIQSLTNAILYHVQTTPNQTTYSCGQHGIIVQGRHDSWRVIEQTVCTDTFWSCAFFKDHLYLSSSNGIYKLVDNDLEQVDIIDSHGKPLAVKRGISFYRLHTNGEVLWSVGSKMAMWSTDGKSWEEIPYS